MRLFKFSPVKGKYFLSYPDNSLMFIFRRPLRRTRQAIFYFQHSERQFLISLLKKIGKFSGALHDLKIGEKVEISSPRVFYPEDGIKILFLAGGIGITPFTAL